MSQPRRCARPRTRWSAATENRKLSCPRIFESCHVIQRERPQPLWGMSTPAPSAYSRSGSLTGLAPVIRAAAFLRWTHARDWHSLAGRATHSWNASCGPSGGVERPRRAVRFAGFIQRRSRVHGGHAGRYGQRCQHSTAAARVKTSGREDVGHGPDLRCAARHLGGSLAGRAGGRLPDGDRVWWQAGSPNGPARQPAGAAEPSRSPRRPSSAAGS
jgi:hypothetical protein